MLDREEAEEYVALLEEIERREARRKFYRIFPDEDVLGPDGKVLIHARAGYRGQMEFFRAGAQYRERAMLASNRIGKTESGCYEVTCHLTGLYPHWWEGRRFSGPVRFWAAGKFNETTRDIVQRKLLGPVTGGGAGKSVEGTGMIPGHLLGVPKWKQGITDFIDTIQVKHVTGRWSSLGLKSYQQGRGSFEGTEQHGIWLDEEPPLDVYEECLVRTATTGGIVMLTFTPLEGISDTVKQFLPGDYFTRRAE